MRKLLIAVSLLFTFVIGIGGTFLFLYNDFKDTPIDPAAVKRGQEVKIPRFLSEEEAEELRQDKVRFITIPKGYNFSKAVDLLETKGIISSALMFRIFSKLEGGKYTKRGLKAGDFAFHPSWKPPMVLQTLFSKPLIYMRTVTFPEGFNLHQIASRLESKEIIKKKEFLQAAFDKKFLKKLKIPSNRVEGYLFPETYKLQRNSNPYSVIKRMVQEFRKHFPGSYNRRARALNMSPHEIVTLASIVEKETGQPHERPLVSSVFHNRLKKKMKLQTDPTTCYAIMELAGWPGTRCNITRTNKMIKSPYNTYYAWGLPPGPIASPGKDAIHAALWPKKSRYLFFVSKNDGTHIFTRNYAAHQKLVRKYQSGGKPGKTTGAPPAGKKGSLKKQRRRR